MKANGVKVVEDWNTAYYTEFSGSSGKGPRPIVVSYASSPPAEVVFADPPIDQAPTAAITAPKTCFRQIEFAGILKGTQNRDLAEKWLDFMLSVPYQEDLPLNQFVYPVNPQAKLPEAFVKWSTVARATRQARAGRDCEESRSLDRGVDERGAALRIRSAYQLISLEGRPRVGWIEAQRVRRRREVDRRSVHCAPRWAEGFSTKVVALEEGGRYAVLSSASR